MYGLAYVFSMKATSPPFCRHSAAPLCGSDSSRLPYEHAFLSGHSSHRESWSCLRRASVSSSIDQRPGLSKEINTIIILIQSKDQIMRWKHKFSILLSCFELKNYKIQCYYSTLSKQTSTFTKKQTIFVLETKTDTIL
jgi:hypothetical protein